MKVIVIGAGVGGTSAALALQKLGHEVVVYDRMRENRPVGAALSLWSNGVKVLNWLGLGAQVAALGGRMDDMAYYDGHTGDEMCRFSLAPVTAQTGQRPYPVARADLQQLMMDAVGAENIRLGRQLTGVSEADGVVTATFADGSIDTADLLIGADGARSIVRDHVTEPAGIRPERRYSGYVNYNGLVAADPRIGPLDQWTTYVGDGKRCAVMPVAGDRFYFFVDVPGPSGVTEDRMAALEHAFGSWGAPGVRALLDGIDPDESLNRVEIWDIDPFDTWVRGRVAILGDAAHNTAPDIGQGACSALEDSFALGIVFATSTLGVEDSLKRYERIRTERAGDLVLRARKRAHETHAFDVDTTQAWYDGLRREDGTGVIRGIVGNIDGSPVELGASVLG
ncbi:FAD-dependent urate hydroxylase HpxO [Microbacterium sp. KSW2-21]|uniref:FAD-dependent urate hydroxylase n=1 Tax=Microbacterium algihabitans TaxID=3075992 RepID=A0ABU3RU34_9MICO|nr:FAD-dependent urate hydroxylase HpxO [Microbacterium sp. KSW2-21]MDU0326075.1 FAD-dependent urate hydroxylase HpxO [Microbacterium sp. KSW2-21]